MKKTHLSRRLLSLILALAIVVSLFAGLTITAFAHTGTAPDLPSANTKVRHQVCTSLSSQAAAYYTGQYTYAQMSQLSGVNNAEDCWATTQNNPLYTRLQTLMSSTHTFYTDYSGTSAGDMAYYWTRTDAQNSSSTYYCFYTDLLYDGWSSNAGMQREHIWPKSNASFYQTNGGADMHHLRPSVGTLNNSKSNNYFGEIHDSATANYIVSGNEETKWWSDGGVFEPKDSIKGDIARILLYVYCRWGQPNLYTDVTSSKLPAYDSDDSQNNGTRAIDGRAMLLRWMENDPVDTWEMERNDRVQDVQGNRNVFIDYPEYAWLVFGLTPPSNYTTPSGMAAASGTSYTITAVSNNNSYGTVSLSGSVITATPASGYYAAGYLVTSGSATVTQSGNTFTVSASSNCTVQIIFAQIQTYTVTYMANGSQYSTATAYAGNSVTLPNNAPAVSGWTFIGWTDNAGYTNGGAQPANFYEKGTGYTVNVSATLYAVYRQSSGTGSSTNYELTTNLTDGDYVIGTVQGTVGTDTAIGAINGTYSSGWQKYDVTTPANSVISNPSSTIVWTLQNQTGGGFTLKNKSTNKYLTITTGTGSGSVNVGDSGSTMYTSVLDSSASTFKIKPSTSSTNQLACNFGSGYGYRMYANRDQGTASGICVAIRFYKQGAGYTYSITPSGQAHSHTLVLTAANAETCTAAGNSAYYTCSGCGLYFSDAQGNNQIAADSWVIPATGHNYVASVTQAATCGAAGVRTYTCSRCSDSYTETIPATGAHNYVAAVTEPTTSAAGYTTYTCSVCGDSYVDQNSYTYRVTYLTPAGVAAPSSVISGENTLVTPPTLSDTNGWTFVGWVKNSYDNVTTAPTEMIFDAENRVHVTNECLTLYALFTKTETSGGGTPVTTYELVDSASDVDAGTYVITWENSQYLPSETTANKNPAVGTGITVSSDKLTNTVTSDMLWTLTGNNTSGFAVTHTANGTTWYLGAYNNAQGILIDTSGATTDRFYNWKASDDGTYGMLFRCSDGGTRNLAVYTPTSGTPTWRYYTTGSSYKGALRLYKETTSGGGTSTTTYTTVFAVTCDHADAELTAAVAATCTAAGVSAYWYCPDCGLYFADDDGDIGDEIATAGTEIPALGHDYQEVDREDATCVDAGYVEYECSRCHTSYRDTLAATGIHVDANSDDVCDVCGDDMPVVLTYALTTTLGNCDQVVIYYPTSSLALSTTASGSKLAGVAASPSNDTLTVEDDTIAVMTVEYADNTNFYLKTADGKYLTAPASGNGLSFETSAAANDCSLWYLTNVDTTNNTVSIQNVGAAYNNNHNQALEYYNGFTTYGIKTTAAYTFQLYSRAHVHSWNEGALTTEATCTAAGEKTYTCTVCAGTRTEEIEALGHEFSVDPDVGDNQHYLAPTCTDDGMKYLKCSRCDVYSEDAVILPATGHSMTEYSGVEPTCTGSGQSTYYSCSLCNKYFSDAIGSVEMQENEWYLAPLGHDYVSHNAQDPTCTEIGWAAYETCTRCDYTNYTEIPATGHSLTETPAVTETCTSDGNSAYWTCSYCSKYFSDASGENEIAADSWVIPATGHSLTETPAEAATCTTDGNSAYWTCDYCNKYYSDEDGVNEITMDSWVIYATGHTYGAPVEENRVEPTVTADGSYDTVVYCSVCGEEVSRVPNTIEKLKVEVVGNSLTTEGDVLLNAYLSIPEAAVTGSSDLKVVLYENGEPVQTLSVDSSMLTSNGYKFQLAKPAKNMHDTVTLKLFDDETEVPIYDETGSEIDFTYSVQSYLNTVMTDYETNPSTPYSAELYALCVAMSNYGSYAQAQQNFETETTMESIREFNVNGENIVDIANVTKDMVTTTPAASATPGTAELRFYGASLVMESEMVLRFYFWYNGSGTLQANGTDLQRSGSSRYYYYDVTNIKASDFDEGCGFTVSDGTNSITVSSFSVYTYVLSVLNAESGTLAESAMQDLVRGIVVYGKMAEAYYATQQP